ncbi:MAG: DUF3592 domain-containing protein [Nitrospinota bacterium]|nr:DUF3592 domain-containing protein [Nitrospinota bacterium]
MEVTFWLGCLFSVLGLAIIIQQQFLKYKARSSQSWPTTEGTILKSEVISKSNYNQGTSTYRANIVYDYTVKARRYKGENVCLSYDVGTGSRSRAERRCSEYPVGRKVTVYYNPNNSSDACLERRADAPVFITIIAAAFMFFGWGMILGFFK